ncbi:putative MFS transporter [Thermosporothrix hazakensis]|uniref:MFS transporter n=2 Tax=Thermosporothrix TaxID=768650 RepID=A0A455SQU3_9CHLR|nr:MFS transporter [Thermosporothrix hazakensis]PZW25451.1 putative MFS transporter [Thermosporothrix hazakensis]BBH90787.1 MFS transporter [Thermosporothrix sp. COM3]GCE48837.1 MFS transporter [Thermosporothrix hazakensis]
MDVAEKRVTIAARMDRLPLSRMHRRLTVVLGIGTFFDLYDIFLASVLTAILTSAFRLDTVQQALLLSSGFIGMFIGASAMGIVSDYIGRRTMYMVDLLVYSVFSLAAAFAPDFLWLVLFRFLAGIGLGAEPPLTDIYMGEMIPRYARGKYTAWCYTVGFLGVPLAGFAGNLLVKVQFLSLPGWRWLLIIGALGAVIVWFLRRSLPESPRWYEIRHRFNEAEKTLSVLEEEIRREHGLDRLPEPVPVVVEEQKKATFVEIFSGQYTQRTVMLWIFQILQTVGYYGFGSLATLALKEKGIDVVQTLQYTGLIFLGYPLGSLASVPVIERFERKFVIIISAALIAIFGLVFGFATAAPIIVVSGFLVTAVSNLFSNAFHIYQAEIFPTRMRGTAVGIAYSLSRITTAVLPFIALPALKLYGPGTVFIGSALIMGLVCLDVGVLGPRSTGRALESIAH